jgi:hypothetical protein
VWQQSDSQDFEGLINIYANRFNGTAWGTAELIETGEGNTVNPQVAIDSNGHAIAVWRQWDGTAISIYTNRFNGTDWGTAELIETGDAGNAYVPQVALDSNGNAIAVWYQSDGTKNNIYANRFNGSAWGIAELIETGEGNAFNPQVALDSNGHAIAVWTQYDGANDNIYANRFNGTAWGTAELIETDDAGSAFNPQVAVDSNGHAIAVWQQSDSQDFEGLINIYANRFNGSAWGIAELIETDDAGRAINPQVAVDNNGHAIAVWHQYDGTKYNIYANRFNGTAWGTAELIETDDAGNAFNPQVALDSNGNAIAVWYQYDGANDNIYANRFNGSSWGTAQLVENESGRADSPQVALDSNGNAIAVWTQWDGTALSIYANRFK